MSSQRARRIALALACIVLPHQAAAQGVFPGVRVRVVDVSSAAPVLTGQLVRKAGDTVIVSSAAATPTVFVVGAGHRLEVSAGTHRRTLRGVGLGFLVGAATGAVLGLASYQEPDCSQSFICLDFGPGFAALAGAVVFSVPGMVIGGIVGAKKHEVWRRVGRLPVHVGIAPAAGPGLRLTASVAF